MPFVLIIAFAASLGMHGLVLFGPELDLSIVNEPPPLVVELQPLAKPVPPVELPAKPAAKTVAAKRRPLSRKASAPPARPAAVDAPDSPAVLDTPGPQPEAAAVAETPVGLPTEPTGEQEPAVPSPLAMPSPVESPLPARGRIRYRVDRGDQGFQIGSSVHEWEVIDGAYRITAVTETTGLVAVFRPLRVELESRGRMTVAGLVPEHFVTRQPGRDTGEQTEFDWAQMQLRMPGRPAQTLSWGAQDLLSFNYQLGLIDNLASGSRLGIVTGKKYAAYRLEVVGDEDIETPAGTFRCLHLRVPGVATTELWLAYDRHLLPVKIQHTDRRGDVFVQVATAFDLPQEP